MTADRSEFLKRTEDLVRPDDVAFFAFFGGLLGRLPLAVQRAMVPSDPEASPPMGFVVEPYATFTCHAIADEAAAQALIPDNYRIVPTAVFAGDEPRPCVIFGAFAVHASGFWGVRVEMYVIAESIDTGMRSWVIADYDSNTLSFDPGQGFVGAGAKRAVVTSTHRGTSLVDVVGDGRRIALEAALKRGQPTPLDPELWLEGNLSVAYGGEAGDGTGKPLGLIFEPEEMAEAWRLPVDAVAIEELSWHPGLFEPEPFTAVCFPYAQHFVTSTAPTGSRIRDAAGLREATAALSSGPPSEGFSAAPIKRSMAVGFLLSGAATLGLVVWTALHLLLAHP